MNLESIFKRGGDIPKSPLEKALEFYRLSIEVERLKEPDVGHFFYYDFHYKQDSKSLLLVDLPCNNDFLKAFNDNSKERRYPKDLYIGLKVKYLDEIINLFGFTIEYSDLENFNPEKELLPVPFEYFEINSKCGIDMELTDDQMSEINAGFHRGMTFDDIKELLKSHIDEDIVIQEGLYLALTGKAIDLAQLYSEFQSKRWIPAARSSELLNSILTNTPNRSYASNMPLSKETILKVTQLDNSQSYAVKMALSNQVSVITGPPGTGKTQVIQNILANALMLGKSVLVASKNNKAVDNVKERFDALSKYDYLIRFGSKYKNQTLVLPSINNHEESSLEPVNDEYDIFNEYEQKVLEINSAKNALARLAEVNVLCSKLSKEIEGIEEQISLITFNFDKKISDLDESYYNLSKTKNLPISYLNNAIKEITVLKSKIINDCSGFGGFWHRIFSISGYVNKIFMFYNNLLVDLKTAPPLFEISETISKIKKYKELIMCCDKMIICLNRVIYYVSHREIINHKKKDDIEPLDKKRCERQELKSTLSNEANSLNINKGKYEETISLNEKWIVNNSRTLLNACVERYLSSIENADNNNYLQIIKKGIPWESDEYSSYIDKFKKILERYKLISVTNLSIKNSLPLTNGLIDILVVDEASQCDVASALPLITRAKQIVVIGDPMQLRHISRLQDKEEQAIKEHLNLQEESLLGYNKTSLWDFCYKYLLINNLCDSCYCVLSHHYRCHPEIIAYSNHMFYESQMKFLMSVETDIDRLIAHTKGLFIMNIKGRQDDPNSNINELEAKECVKLAMRLRAENDENVTIGITSPFKHQAEHIFYLLKKAYNEDNNTNATNIRGIEVNTVHKFQGDEKDIIIFSPMVASGSALQKINWIDSGVPYLVNVAVTRARSALYVVCDVDYIKAHSSSSMPLGNLVSQSLKNNQ